MRGGCSTGHHGWGNTAGGDLDQGLDGLWALATSAGSRRKPCTRKQCWEVTPPTKSANINWADGLWHLCLSIRQTHEPSRAQWGPEGWRLLSSSTVVTKVTHRSPQKGTSLVVQGYNVHVWLSPFAAHLKLPQDCLLISYTPIQNKKFKYIYIIS